MDLEEIGINARNWVDSAQDRDYWRALVIAALSCILRKRPLTLLITVHGNPSIYFRIPTWFSITSSTTG